MFFICNSKKHGGRMWSCFNASAGVDTLAGFPPFCECTLANYASVLLRHTQGGNTTLMCRNSCVEIVLCIICAV